MLHRAVLFVTYVVVASAAKVEDKPSVAEQPSIVPAKPLIGIHSDEKKYGVDVSFPIHYTNLASGHYKDR
jgi:hypothetical protein